ncbi:MAG: GvpL/GvpF family gas vesicle protein [Pseudomonadota bacterium]
MNLMIIGDTRIVNHGQNRNRLIHGLISHRRELEELHTCGTVIPVSFGAPPISHHGALSIVEGLTDPLHRSLRALHSQSEWQVTIRWKSLIAWRKVNHHKRSSLRHKALRIARLQKATADLLYTKIEAMGFECIRHATADPEVLLATSILAPDEDLPKLESALNSIDAKSNDELSIRLAGPLPAVSFCALNITAQEEVSIRKPTPSERLKGGNRRNAIMAAANPIEASRIATENSGYLIQFQDEGYFWLAEIGRGIRLERAPKNAEESHVTIYDSTQQGAESLE